MPQAHPQVNTTQDKPVVRVDTGPIELPDPWSTLEDGGFVRCPSCYNWIDYDGTGRFMWFDPWTGQPAIKIALCHRCAKLAEPGQEGEAMARRCSLYLYGEEGPQ